MKINKYFLIATYVVYTLLSGCNHATTEEVIEKYIYVYNNKLDVPISLKYYITFDNQIKTKNVIIEANGSVEESYDIRYGRDWIYLFGCDSVRIEFDSKKKLWYFMGKEQDKTGNVFMIKNYKTIGETKNSVTYEYDFNQSIYDLATDIAE